MGLGRRSVGKGALDIGLDIKKRAEDDLVVALAGNPNVGKSTVFNALTGLRQHTGNWPGKTVANAQGYCTSGEQGFVLVDIPGTYSLMAHSAEEEVARNFICFAAPDAVAVVCDATCLLRNLNLVLQTLEVTGRAVVCVNLMDEARRHGISVNLARLSERLGVPVVGTVARKKKTLSALLSALGGVARRPRTPRRILYDETVEAAIATVEAALAGAELGGLSARWLALRLLDADEGLLTEIGKTLGEEFLASETLVAALEKARAALASNGLDGEGLRDSLVSSLSAEAERICDGVVESEPFRRAARIDRIVTGKWTAYPLMLLMLAGIFWLTAVGANYPSAALSSLFEWLGGYVQKLLAVTHAPPWLYGVLYDGVWRVLTAVVAVMLPPMAIFFPLFTLMEDVGLLPRIAYNLDRPFCRCNACGKQALTMCMGFGCNAAGVVGCRIIDSPRERMLAILTNVFVPCNGRFPALITIFTLLLWGVVGIGRSLGVALLMTGAVVLSILMTFAATRLLSATLLRGTPSSFTLELPPYRRPQIGQVLVRSVFDRTLFVLGRAVAVAAPAGLVIWLLANFTVGESSLLLTMAHFLDPVGRVMGLDGAILLGFLLGFPASEIVLPLILMIYSAGGTLPAAAGIAEISDVFLANGWTTCTVVCFVLFLLMHFPCSTTVLTIKRETGSWRWSAVALLLPTLFGVIACILTAGIFRLFGAF